VIVAGAAAAAVEVVVHQAAASPGQSMVSQRHSPDCERGQWRIAYVLARVLLVPSELQGLAVLFHLRPQPSYPCD